MPIEPRSTARDIGKGRRWKRTRVLTPRKLIQLNIESSMFVQYLQFINIFDIWYFNPTTAWRAYVSPSLQLRELKLKGVNCMLPLSAQPVSGRGENSSCPFSEKTFWPWPVRATCLEITEWDHTYAYLCPLFGSEILSLIHFPFLPSFPVGQWLPVEPRAWG